MLLLTHQASAQDAVPWARSLEDAQQIAGQRGQLILLHFYGDNCPPCKQLEANVFPRPEFARGLTANYVPVKINASENRQLAARYGVDRWPTDVVVAADGTPLTRPTVSPQDPNKFLANLDQIAALHRVRMNPDAAVAQNVAYTQPPSTSQYAPQSAPTGGATQGQFAASPPADGSAHMPPQQQAYDPRGYQPQNMQSGLDRRSSFQPAGGVPAYEPAAQPRSMYPNQPLPVGENARGMQSEASGMVYGAQAERRDVRLSDAPTAGAPVTQPMDAGRSQFQTNQFTAGNAAAAPTASSNPPLGLDGYCPVALTEAAKWTKGDVRFGAIHRGRTYLFTTQADQQKFMSNPDKYSPMLSGFDAVKFAEEGKLVDGKRQHGIVHDGQMYLFADEAALEKFCSSPNNYCGHARQAMQQSVTPNTYR